MPTSRRGWMSSQLAGCVAGATAVSGATASRHVDAWRVVPTETGRAVGRVRSPGRRHRSSRHGRIDPIRRPTDRPRGDPCGRPRRSAVHLQRDGYRRTRVLDVLDVESAVWVGHSMGGSVVAAVQAMAPDRVDGLVYFSCSPGFGEGPSPEFLDLVLRDEPGDSDTAIAWAVDVSRWSLGRQFDEATAPADAARLVDEFAWWGIPVAHLAASLVGLPGIASFTPSETATIVMFGDQDEMTDAGRAFARSMPGATTVEIEGYAHWFPEPGPWTRIADAMCDLAEVRTGGTSTRRV